MKQMIAEGVKVQTVVTSPPYWSLRDYGIPPSLWGGAPDCQHEWVLYKTSPEPCRTIENGFTFFTGNSNSSSSIGPGKGSPIHETMICQKCGAVKCCFGLEPTHDLYVQHAVEVFRLAMELLADDGILWLNLGDSYFGSWGNYHPNSPPGKHGQRLKETVRWNRPAYEDQTFRPPTAGKVAGLKPKDLVGIPWAVAFALRNDGWYLRSASPWVKRNCCPESCKDRPTTALEYIFLLSKSERYFYDYKAVQLPASLDTHARYARGRSDNHKWADGPGHQTIHKSMDHNMIKVPDSYKGSVPGRKDGPGQERRSKKDRLPGVNPKAMLNAPGSGVKQNESFSAAIKDIVGSRNRRNSDWWFESLGMILNEEGMPLGFDVPTQGFSGAHFATFPPRLIEPMILAGSRPGDIVLDPFGGSGTVGEAAGKLGRQWILIDLNHEYQQYQTERTRQGGLPLL